MAILAACMTYGCAAAFGPGYTVEKQRVQVTYTEQAADKVSIRAWYDLKNTGTKPLHRARNSTAIFRDNSAG